MNSELIQLIDIILYRLHKSLTSAHKGYFNFKARNDARSPTEILSHLVDVSNYDLSIVGAEKLTNLESSVLEKISDNFVAMKAHLTNNAVNEDATKKSINGPLSDTLTHIGQLALLRRLEGNPIEWENYTNADI